MIALGLRLAVRSGREAVVRLTITAAAVAIGVGLLVATLAGINAVSAQNSRYAWLATTAPATPVAPSAQPLWGLLTSDFFAGQIITRADVAATGPRSPVPPGIPRLPLPGQFYASPALSKLLASTPAAELRDRYPGTMVGIIGSVALPSPTSLIIVIGHTVNQLAHQPGAAPVTAINTTAPSSCGNCPVGVGINASGIDLILGVIAGALLFPVLIFIGSATRLSAGRREQRYAAMRLIGATPRQISLLAIVESSVATAAGTTIGFALFFLLRPALAGISFTGATFYPHDLSLNATDIIAVAIGVPIAAGASAGLALRRVQISPLGVTRRVTPRPPHARRILLLVAGVAELSYFIVGDHPNTGAGQVTAYLPGFLLIMAGLILAGPWFAMLAARAMSGHTNRPAVLIAARRLSDNPQAGFRAISGLVLALFVGTAAVGVITTFSANRGVPRHNAAAANTLTKSFIDDNARPGQPHTPIAAIPAALLTELGAIPGVRGVTVLHADPTANQPDTNGFPDVVVSCAQLARTPVLGHCVAGAQAATISSRLDGNAIHANTVWPPATEPSSILTSLPIRSIVLATNGSTTAIERARTELERADPLQNPPTTIGELNGDNARQTTQYQQLANIVILFSLLIAGCSLAVSVAGGVTDRKRPFSLLRLAGVPLALLRRVVSLESIAPLVASASVSIAAGFLAAQLFLRSQLGYTLREPNLSYYVVLLAGLTASVAIITSTFPLLRKTTGPETARNE